MTTPKPKGCTYVYTATDLKGQPCGDTIFACELCTRHYAQKRRKTLGKTKEIASPGEGTRVDVCVTLDPESLKKLDRRAKALKLTRSEILDQYAASLD